MRAHLLTRGRRGALASSPIRPGGGSPRRRRKRDDHDWIAVAAPPPGTGRPDPELVAGASRQILLSARIPDDQGGRGDLLGKGGVWG